jgi:hypothetical protein
VSGASVEISSGLGIAAERIWERATSPAGIAYELRPLVRMTMPPGLADARIEDLPRGRPLGRCWLLLFGLLPVEYDALCLVEVDPPRRFLERSRMLTLSLWEHERLIEPLPGGGCTVTDRLRFELRPALRRLPGVVRLTRRVVTTLFAHRHRRLRTLDNGGR